MFFSSPRVFKLPHNPLGRPWHPNLNLKLLACFCIQGRAMRQGQKWEVGGVGCARALSSRRASRRTGARAAGTGKRFALDLGATNGHSQAHAASETKKHDGWLASQTAPLCRAPLDPLLGAGTRRSKGVFGQQAAPRSRSPLDQRRAHKRGGRHGLVLPRFQKVTWTCDGGFHHERPVLVLCGTVHQLSLCWRRCCWPGDPPYLTSGAKHLMVTKWPDFISLPVQLCRGAAAHRGVDSGWIAGWTAGR